MARSPFWTKRVGACRAKPMPHESALKSREIGHHRAKAWPHPGQKWPAGPGLATRSRLISNWRTIAAPREVGSQQVESLGIAASAAQRAALGDLHRRPKGLVQRLLGELEVTGARTSVASTRRRRSR